MKKFVSIILIMLMALTCVIAFVGCNNNDEIFIGAVSKSTYSSKEDAVKGFLKEEISGQMFTAEYVGYTKIADLSQKEIAKLKIDEEFKDGIVNVEKGEVEYIEKEVAPKSELLTKLAYDTCKKTVYIVTYEHNDENLYRFLTPTEEVGQSPTASSLSSIFDKEKYLNCTLLFEVGVDLDNVANFKNHFKFAENGIYNICTGESDDFTDERCRVVYNDTLYDVSHKIGNEKWRYVSKEDDYSNVSDYARFLIEVCFFDCWLYLLPYYSNCFEKTDTGYALSRQIVIANMDNAVVEDYKIVISNERIANATIRINSNDMTFEYSTTFSDFGTTTVDIPKEAMDAVKEYADNLPKPTEPTPIEPTPAEKDDEIPSESELESLIDVEKYYNCTYNMMVIDVDGGFALKITDNALYFYGEFACDTLISYIGQKVYKIEKNMENWEVKLCAEFGSETCPFSDWSSYKKYTINSFLGDEAGFGFIDNYYNYFVKTESGYSFIASKFGYNDLSGYKDFNVIVSNGKIVECVYTANDDYVYKCTFSDFGTTEFELTDDILQAIEDYENNNQ